jgi:hypothetical protein
MCCFGLSLAAILVINYSNKSLYDNAICKAWLNRAIFAFAFALGGGLLMQLVIDGVVHSDKGSAANSAAVAAGASSSGAMPYIGNSPACLDAISRGHWVETRCDTDPTKLPPGAPVTAFCQTAKWIWEPVAGCSVSRMSTSRLRSVYTGKKILFAGDSELRSVFLQFVRILDPDYHQDITTAIKHSDIHYTAPFDPTLSVDFTWAPMAKDVTGVMQAAATAAAPYHLIAAGSACWDALNTKDLAQYSAELTKLSVPALSIHTQHNATTKLVWLQPTTIHASRLPTEEKQKYMSEAEVQKYRAAFLASPLAAAVDTVIDSTQASAGKAFPPVDGLHYTEDVYEVLAFMVSNGYTAHYPAYSSSGSTSASAVKYTPKVTGSMSFPSLGAGVLALAVIMLFSMDSFFGIGFLSLLLLGRSFDWEAAYAGLHRKIDRDLETAAAAATASAATAAAVNTADSRGGASNRDLESDSLLEMKNQGAK